MDKTIGVPAQDPAVSPPFWREYGFAVSAVAAATAFCFLINPFFSPTNLVMIYLLGVLATAARGHRGPAALASVLSVLCFDFCFVPPRFTFRVSDTEYLLTFAVMFVAAMVISHLTVRLREEAESARQGQSLTSILHAFTQQLAGSRGTDRMLKSAVDHLAKVFNGEVIAYVPEVAGGLKIKAHSGVIEDPGDKERGVAQWVYDRWQAAGIGTQALPDEEAYFVPLQGSQGPVGVLRVHPRNRADLLFPGRRMLLESFAHQIALALEVDRLEDNARRSEMEAETERMRSSLLSAVSHDFRTPLAAILGSAEALMGKEELAKNLPTRELLENIQTEAERLSRLVQNLLEATRLESIRLQKELYPLEEVIGSALERLAKSLGSRDVDVDIPEDLPPIPMDGVLVEQVLINLLENAVRHSAADGRIDVSASVGNGSVIVAVADRGPGLKEDELEKVFEKFYREKTSPGAGLGLAICRAVVNVHGGKIWAENRTGGGALFQFTLPQG